MTKRTFFALHDVITSSPSGNRWPVWFSFPETEAVFRWKWWFHFLNKFPETVKVIRSISPSVNKWETPFSHAEVWCRVCRTDRMTDTLLSRKTPSSSVAAVTPLSSTGGSEEKQKCPQKLLFVTLTETAGRYNAAMKRLCEKVCPADWISKLSKSSTSENNWSYWRHVTVTAVINYVDKQETEAREEFTSFN